MLNELKLEANRTRTENGAAAYRTSGSSCLDLFASIGALRDASEDEIISRFIPAFAEDPDLAVKTLFFARDIRGGLGERRVFRIIFRWLADRYPETVRKNISLIGDYGRFDDLMVLFDTACEKDMLDYIRTQLEKDQATAAGGSVSLLAKWLPSVNTSNQETVQRGKKVARALGLSDAAYRKMLSALRKRIGILENNLREKDYSFDYEKQPSKALFKYRAAFMRNDGVRYGDFIRKAAADPTVLHTGTLAPYEIIRPLIYYYGSLKEFSAEERKTLDVTWNAQEDFTGDENALVVVDGSGSMYMSGDPKPAAVAESLAIYFAERNKGAFHNHFITFSMTPQLVEIKGRDIFEKVEYCIQYHEVANTDLEAVFRLILNTAVKYGLPQEEMPEKLYIISDMEFDYCCRNASLTIFEAARQAYEAAGYRLPHVVFWNVQSRNRQQPVSKNEQGVTLVSGCSPQIFSMLKDNELDPYTFMLKVLRSARYEAVSA